MIRAEGLSKSYWVHKRQHGMTAALRSLVRRKHEEVVALRDVSFRIEAGEKVGFLGPNGAGKTTLMKLLSGLLHPTAGRVEIDGFLPHRRDYAFLRRITMVMGNKSQLIWDLPPADTFEMIRAIYRVAPAEHARTMDELTELLDLAPLVHKPTRQLSLGERMRCELAATLIHQPTTLFLDEPTIGLDVSMQAALRDFVAAYNRRHNATILLTSHYMQDVLVICPRVIIINHGQLIYDGDLRAFVATIRPEKVVSFEWEGDGRPAGIERFGAVDWPAAGRPLVRVPQAAVLELVRLLMNETAASDLKIEDPPLDDVLREAFGQTRALAEPT